MRPGDGRREEGPGGVQIPGRAREVGDDEENRERQKGREGSGGWKEDRVGHEGRERIEADWEDLAEHKERGSNER